MPPPFGDKIDAGEVATLLPLALPPGGGDIIIVPRLPRVEQNGGRNSEVIQ